jgi:hypothetical protein
MPETVVAVFAEDATDKLTAEASGNDMFFR